jgi:type VI secretion system protein ImpK
MSVPAASPDARRDATTAASWRVRLRAAEGTANPLLEAARPLLEALSDTPTVLDLAGVDQHRQWLVHQVQQFGKVCATLQLPPPQVDKARYCLCSALDEAAALTGWGHGTATGMEWEANGLASIFGYDRQGCDRVYTIAAHCMREPEKNRALLEVIQSILDRGFQGRYRFVADGRHQIEAIRSRIREAADAELAHPPAGPEPAPAPLHRLPIPGPDAQRRPATPACWRSRLWLAIGALCLALLAAAGGVAYWRDTQTKPAEPAMSPIDVLAKRLTGRLAKEVNAGTVTLAENAQRTALTLRLEGIFEAGDSTVNPWVEPTITAIGQEIAPAPGKVLVTGHTDNQPFERSRSMSNQMLSEVRAKEVVQILVSAGVPTDRIAAAGKGNTEPAADNGTPQGRMKNRRVEITVSE